MKDIESLRDERLAQISGQRRAAEAYIEDAAFGRLSALQSRALNFKPYNEGQSARRMPDDLAEDLMRTLNEMRSQRMALNGEGCRKRRRCARSSRPISIAISELRQPVSR